MPAASGPAASGSSASPVLCCKAAMLDGLPDTVSMPQAATTVISIPKIEAPTKTTIKNRFIQPGIDNGGMAVCPDVY
eukprot:271167-Amphidinium_carterae.1